MCTFLILKRHVPGTWTPWSAILSERSPSPNIRLATLLYYANSRRQTVVPCEDTAVRRSRTAPDVASCTVVEQADRSASRWQHSSSSIRFWFRAPHDSISSGPRCRRNFESPTLNTIVKHSVQYSIVSVKESRMACPRPTDCIVLVSLMYVLLFTVLCTYQCKCIWLRWTRNNSVVADTCKQ